MQNPSIRSIVKYWRDRCFCSAFQYCFHPLIEENPQIPAFLQRWAPIPGFLAELTIVIAMFITGCSKAPAPDPPGISFIRQSGYLFNDTVLETGQKVKIGIRAVTTAVSSPITYFSVRFSEGTEQILLDSGMSSSSFQYDLDVIKTNAPVETWTFLIMDRNRIEQKVQIRLTKAEVSKWGKIRTFSDIMLGAQENTAKGSFYSIRADSVMPLSLAYENQPLVDMLYYYGQYQGTLSSPNEAEAPLFFTGPQGIANWTVKNEMRYDTTLITAENFDKSANDSLILSAYQPTSGKKKGKFAAEGMVFSFRSPAGKLGLLKVQQVTPQPVGAIRFTIKIQD